MSDVPSNLIPTRVTQLPVAPVADENSLMMIVYQGNNYQIRVGDLLSVAGVPITRQVIAGTGLQGGGQLANNVTLSIAPGGVGSTQLANSGVTPGSYGDATNIPVLTVDATGRVMAATTIPATISGYVPDSRQVIAGTGLNGGGLLATDVTINANLSNATPQSGFQSGSAGVSTDISRADHKHPAVNLALDDEVDGILGLSNGGTAKSLVPNAGAIIWCGADGLYVGPVGTSGQVLVSNGTGEYTWGSALLVIDQPANVVYAGPASGPDAPTTFRALVNADIPATLNAKTLTNVTVSSGSINNTQIGNSTPAAITGTTVTATSQFAGAGTGLTGTASGLSIGGNAATATSATTATNVAGGTANQIVYNTGAGATSFVVAPTVGNTFLEWSGSAFQWSTNPLGTVTSVDGSGGTTGLTFTGGPITSSGTLTLSGTLIVANGGTGATSLTGYVKGNGASAMTAAATIPNTDITGLGTMSTQAASAVAITGGAIDGTTVGGTVPAAGTFTSVAMTSGTITTPPSTGNDIVNKTYADSIAAGINFHQSCKYATTAALPAVTYANGTGGVGATLTANANGALTVDGYTFTSPADNGTRILIKNQAATLQNGVYTLSQAGDAGNPFILTRATDFDTAGSGVDQIDQGDFFLITSGTANANTSWVQQTPLPITVGTTGIVFSQFGAPITYSAGTGLTESPAYTFNIATTGVSAATYGSASQVSVIGVNAQGQITTAVNTSIAIDGNQITSGTVGSSYISGSYTGITGVGTLTTGTWNATTIAVGYGGTGLTTYTNGDLIYASGSATLSKLGIGTLGQVLTAGASAPQYVDQSTLSVGSAASATTAGSVTNSVTFNNGGTGDASGTTFNGSAARTISYNTVGAPSTSGANATGTWNISISGNAATATTATSATSATTATNLAGGAASQIPYQTGSGTTAFLANGTAGQMLMSNGSSAPSWNNVSGGTF